MTSPATRDQRDKVTDAARAAQIALVIALLLTIVGVGLSFHWAHATTSTQQIILGVLLWPGLLVDPSSATAAYLVSFLMQFGLLWLVAFALLRYKVRVTAARERRHAL